jgi:uroporphyrinogen-III synthase
MTIKRILVSQPEPRTKKSPYFELAEKNNLDIHFKPFIQVEGIPDKEFRKTRIDILDHNAVIMTSRTAIDHFFRICEEMRITVPESMKYFCVSESVAFYLQKYIIYRKRKIFYGKGKFQDVIELMKKYKDEKFLVPLSDCHKMEIPKLLDKNKIKYTKAILYRTISTDLSDIEKINYDMLVFYSPSGIKSLLENFPNFKQDQIKIASFGPNTAKAIKNAGLRLDVKAPTTKAPSMTMALEQYIKKANNGNGSAN